MSRLGKACLFFTGLFLLLFVFSRVYIAEWVYFHYVSGTLVFILLGISAWFDRTFWKEFFMMKTTRQGMSMGLMISLVFVSIIAVNVIGFKNYKTFDFSANRRNSLSDQSIKIVKGFQSPLKVLYFYLKGPEADQHRRMFAELLKTYQDVSSQVQLEFIDMNSRPDLTAQYEIKQGSPVAVLDYKGRIARIERIEEQELTSAMVKVTREKDKIVYLLTGHGELSLEPKKDGTSMVYLREVLIKNRYVVNVLNLVTNPKIPEDADMIFVAGARNAFLDSEIAAIESYLKGGGNVLFALEPRVKTGLEPLLAKIGLKAKEGTIARKIKSQLGMPMINAGVAGSVFNPNQAITKPFPQDQFVLFYLPLPLEKVNPVPTGIVVDDLVKTDESWTIYLDERMQEEGSKGPFLIGASAKGKLGDATKDFLAVVLGDSEFMNDQLATKNLNRDLILNATAYLSKEENLISIGPKEVGVTELKLDRDKFILLIFGLIIPLPILLFVASGVLWYRRRYS